MSKRQSEADWVDGDDADEPSLVAQIKLLAEAMAGTQVTELELSENGVEIRLHRQPDHVLPAPARPFVAPRGSLRASPTVAPAPSAPTEAMPAVLAPLTGVFYSAPTPTSPPFVQPGDIVKIGQVVCMVEAMKVFNEIKAEIAGTVVAIPPQSGQLVKKGDPLVRIRAN